MTRMRLLPLSLGALLLAAAGAAAQTTPTRDQPGAAPPAATAVGTASVSGSVTIAGTGDPARRARVQLSSIPVNPSGPVTRISRSATTDDQGRFQFPALPAGRYNLNASKPGHITVSYGQRQPGRPGTPIQLADGQAFAAHLAMPRGSVLTGIILDEHGEATPGTSVRALRYVIQNGVRTLQPAGTGSTDDRGMYRIYGLQPAEYVICAVPRQNVSVGESLEQMRLEMTAMREAASRMNPEQAQALEERMRVIEAQISAQPEAEEPRTGYAPVCYPGSTIPSAAVSVPLGVGQERSGVDFQLQLVPVARVEGTVVSPAGAAPRNLQIQLTPSGPSLPGVGNSSARSGNDGRFRFNNIAPGQYRLTARGSLAAPAPQGGGRQGGRGGGDAPRVWASADITVDGRDIADVMLVLNPGLTVSGQITFDGDGAPPADLSRMRVTLSPVNVPGGPPPGVSSNANTDASGRFSIANVVPGMYRLSASGANGWRAESAVLGGPDSLDFPIEIRPGQGLTGATITLTDRQTEISGAITTAMGEPAPDYTLIIFPSDRRYWTPGARRMQSARPGTDGQFAFRNLPPGDYRIATVVDPEPGSWTDPGYLAELEAVSLRVSLGPGEKKVQNIRVSGAQ
jgi:hypothetical protein